MSKKIDIPKDVKKPEATKAKPEAKKAEAAKAEPKKDAKKIVAAKSKAEETPVKGVDKKEAPKVSQEELKIVEVPDACDAVIDGFKTKGKVGFYDGDSDDCKACGEEFPAAMAACKQNTETEVKMAAIRKAPKKSGGAARGGERTPLGGLASSGAGKNELLLVSKEGASMAEMAVNRGAVSSHLAALKKKGVKIELKDGRYYAIVAVPKVAEVKKEEPKKEAPKAAKKK